MTVKERLKEINVQIEETLEGAFNIGTAYKITQFYSKRRDLENEIVEEEKRLKEECSREKNLPCPFCGETDITVEKWSDIDNYPHSSIECRGCLAEMRCDDHDTNELIREWNIRVNKQPKE